MINSKKNWKQSINVESEKITEIANELNRSSLFVEVCFQRGLKTVDEINNFMNIDEDWFNDPFLMKDMNKAIERIYTAIEGNEQITIYGDYDADGITSTALLYETLDSIGANVNYYLPNRFVEGYGPDINAFDSLINGGTNLIITVDNGVSGHEAINFAQEQNIDVIVTDHHALPSTLPDAYAIIHPAHPEGKYPFSDLAGVGVALKVATAILGEFPIELLDLAAIGTVADLVSLKDENRAIVYFGLQMIQRTQRMGLQELLTLISIESQDIDEETIGFQIGPRLNAIGRLGDASPGVKLLTTHNLSVAKEIAEFIDNKNIERKSIVENITKDAFQKLEEKENGESEVILLADENWHQGVLGIVASRIVEKKNKAVLLFTIDSEKKIAKGSARSVTGINLFENLNKIKELFISFGGHEMAAGMEASVDDLKIIESELSAQIRGLTFEPNIQKIDAFINLNELSIELIKELEDLKPFGVSNPKPIISSSDVTIIQNRLVGLDGSHLKLKVEQSGKVLDVISFRNGELNKYLFNQQRVDLAGYIELNEWNGKSKVQMQMTDIYIPGPIIIDKRITHLNKEYFKKDNFQYIFYNQKNYKKIKDIIPAKSEAIFLKNKNDAKEFQSNKKMIIVDCPSSIDQFRATINKNEKQTIYCYFYKENHLYLTGLPKKNDFKKVYKFIKKNKEIDLQKNGHHMINYLKIESNKIFLIVKVFLEAKFVILNSGLLQINNNPEKKEIEKTKNYQNAVEQFKGEELFIYSSFQEIIDSVKN